MKKSPQSDTSQHPYSFPASARIKKRSEILGCSNSGFKIYSTHFLIILKKSYREVSRIAITITTKIDKRSVARNRLKRRLREYFRNNRSKLVSICDVVIIARRDATELTYPEIREEISSALIAKRWLQK